MRALAPPRQSGVLNKSLGFDRPLSKSAWFRKTLARTGAGRLSAAKPVPPKHVRKGAILGNRAGGPNAAHPVTQTVSTPYLRFETANGKLVAEKPHKPQAGGVSLSSD